MTPHTHGLLRGTELIELQDIFREDYAAMDQLPDALLKSQAGNAFRSLVCMVLMSAALLEARA